MSTPLYERTGVGDHDGESFSVAASTFGVSLTREQYTYHAVFIAPEQLDAVINALIEAKCAIQVNAAHERLVRLCF